MTKELGITGRASTAVLASVWLLSAFFVAVFAWQSLIYLRFPYDLDYCEGCVLADAVNLFNGTGMYGPVQGPPAGVSIYPPLFQFLAGLVVKLAGPSLAITRGLSLISTLAITALIALIVRRFTGNRWVPLLAGACFLASNFVYEWAPLGRIDMLAVALSAGAIYCICRNSTLDGRSVLPAAGLSILAVFTKQTTLAAPTAIFVYLLWSDWRAAVKFGLYCLVGGLAIFGVIQQLTQGRFYFHIITAAFMQVVSTRRAAGLEWNFLRQHMFLLLLSGSWALRALTHRDTGREKVLALWLLTSLAMTATAGNLGSSVNYFIEAIACMSAIAVIEFDRLGRILPGGVIPALLLFQLILFAHVPYRLLGTEALPYPPLGYTPRRQDRAVGEALDKYIRNSDGPILIQDEGYAIRNHRTAQLLNPIMLIFLQAHRQFDSQPMRRGIARGEYPLIVLNWPGALPYDVLTDVAHYYREIAVLRPGGNRFAYHVYAPANPEN